jgi:hypothetical protein
MKINFAENQVSDIRFYTDPDGKFIPPHELKDDEKKLTGFAWRIEEKPTQQDIMIGPLEAERKRLEDERIYLEELALPLPEQTPKSGGCRSHRKGKRGSPKP